MAGNVPTLMGTSSGIPEPSNLHTIKLRIDITVEQLPIEVEIQNELTTKGDSNATKWFEYVRTNRFSNEI